MGGGGVGGFFFNDTATTEIYTLSLHDALPILQKTDTQKSPTSKPVPDTDSNVDTRAPAPGASGNGLEVQSIRVSTPKVDALVDLVGELVITQTMLSQFSEEITPESIEKLQFGLGLLERNTRELQESRSEEHTSELQSH